MRSGIFSNAAPIPLVALVEINCISLPLVTKNPIGSMPIPAPPASPNYPTGYFWMQVYDELPIREMSLIKLIID